MVSIPPFPDLLSLIESRSAALREAAALDLTAAVPGCPGWTVRELVEHHGRVQRFFAAVVRAGEAEGPPAVPPAVPPAGFSGGVGGSSPASSGGAAGSSPASSGELLD